jgi:hypothetical protein
MALEIRRAVEVMIVVMPIILFIFIFALIYVHVSVDIHQFLMHKTKIRLLRFIKVSLYRRTHLLHCQDSLDPKIEEKIMMKFIRAHNRCSLQVLNEVAQELAGDKKDYLRLLVSSKACSRHLKRKYRFHNLTAKLLVTKIVSDLSIPGFADHIEKLLYKNRNKVNVQQTCLLALSSLGETKRMISLMSSPDFQISLSFRTFQELFDAYIGDRAHLITSLLTTASDRYVKRACIKSIGTNQMVELAPLVVPYLEAEYTNQNIQMDAIRTFGLLKYKPAGMKIVPFAQSPQWEVRAITVWTLAEIDLHWYFDVILNLLFDEKWGVRYKAAQVLARYEDHETILDLIHEKNDRYAQDIYQYMLQQKNVFKSEVVE